MVSTFRIDFTAVNLYIFQNKFGDILCSYKIEQSSQNVFYFLNRLCGVMGSPFRESLLYHGFHSGKIKPAYKMGICYFSAKYKGTCLISLWDTTDASLHF